jgi:hypothetical protein
MAKLRAHLSILVVGYAVVALGLLVYRRGSTLTQRESG